MLQMSENKYLTNNEVYYHGREAIPNVNNQNSSSKNENSTNNKVYNHRREVTLSTSNQSTDDLEILKMKFSKQLDKKS